MQNVRDALRCGWTQRAVADAMGLAQSTVSGIATGRLWRELPDEPSADLAPITIAVAPAQRAGDDSVLLVRGRFVTELRRVDIVLCRPLTAEEQQLAA